MIVQLQPEQIASFWEAIKHSVIQVNRLSKEVQQDYTNKTLERLLSGNLQCWVGFTIDEEDRRHINGIYTTSIVGSDILGFNVLSIESIYGFRLIMPEMYEEGIDKLKRFAKANDCKAIVGQSSVKRAQEVMLANGFEVHHTVYRLTV